MNASPSVTKERATSKVHKPYPNFKVIVLDDDFNTFQHVEQCLVSYIPGMTTEQAKTHSHEIHYEGQAIVWIGPQEQAELYHLQLKRAGLTMAPLEAA